MVFLIRVGIFVIGTLVGAAARGTTECTQSERLCYQQRSPEIMPLSEARDIFIVRTNVKLCNFIAQMPDPVQCPGESGAITQQADILP